MITQAAGVTSIETLYLQLLYRCQFRCAHCFHGERLTWRDAYTLDEAISLVELMRRDYQTGAVCLLGGEPFLHPDLGALIAHIKHIGMRTEIVSNGFRICAKLTDYGRDIDMLRISIDGMEEAHDAIRRPGSFREAIAALEHARILGIATGATMTVTASNVHDVLPLARSLRELGVSELKLHHLRPVGNAAAHPELLITDSQLYVDLREQLAVTADCGIAIIVDEELLPDSEPRHAPYRGSAPRIEADPRGDLTFSCNAVGTDAHAISYDKHRGCLRSSCGAGNEVLLEIPPVAYTRV